MITIIVPVYNAEKTLGRCIESAVSQTYSDLEVILVDDGSADNSGRLCDELANNDNRIKVIHKTNGGVSSARNMGLRAAQGEFVMMLDSDDELMPNACTTLIDLQHSENADCIVFGFADDRENITTPSESVTYKSQSEFRSNFVDRANSGLLCNCWNKLYKRNLIKDTFPENISFGEDFVFCLSYLKQCERITFAGEALYRYNDSTVNSISRSFRREKIDEIEYWQSKVLEFVPEERNNPVIYEKYVGDALNYVRELYCDPAMTYKEKKTLLKQWYSRSYIKKMNLNHRGSRFYETLMFLVRHELWLVPQVILSAFKMAKPIKKILIKR